MTLSSFSRIVVMAVGFPLGALAQLSISSDGETYTQDFDDLSSSYLSSWGNDSTLPGWFSGKSSTTSAYRNTAFPVVSYGTSTVPGERALGMSLTGNDDTVWLSARFTNDTGMVLNSFVVSYFVEQYYGFGDSNHRFAEGMQFWTAVDPAITGRPEGAEWHRHQALEYFPVESVVAGSTGNLGFSNFLGAEILNGNHSDYRTLVSGTVLLAGGVAPGETLFLMWGNSSYGNGDRLISDGIAIDDLSVTFSSAATAVPEPSAGAIFGGLTVLGMAVSRRRAYRV